jgi:hypothetical protein
MQLWQDNVRNRVPARRDRPAGVFRAPIGVFGRALIMFVVLCLSENSALASICTTCDETQPDHSYVTSVENHAPGLVAAGSDTSDECCFLCKSCARCGGCCSHAVAPINATSSPLLLSPLYAERGCATVVDHPQQHSSDPLRPPITE